MSAFASPAQLPRLLAEPPWATGARAAELARLPLPPLAQSPRLRWASGEPERMSIDLYGAPVQPKVESREWQESFLDRAAVRPEARGRLRAGEPLQPQDFLGEPPLDGLFFSELLRLPAPMALGLWNALDARCWSSFDTLSGYLLVRHGEAAAPGVLAYARRRPVQGLRAGAALDCPQMAALALKARRGLKVARQPAAEWLLRHAQTSAQVMLRQLFGDDDAAREDARFSLHELAGKGLRDALERAAAGLGEPVAEALRIALDTDPLLRLPARMPKLPAFFAFDTWHRPRLRVDGAALPDDALRNLGLMLALSRAEHVYAGVDRVKAACTPGSLAEFAWDLFEAWWAADAPSKDAWAFTALGLLGDDSTAHRLGPRAMRMAREGAKNRAMVAIDMLGDFGSDAALMHLSNIAERCKVPAVCNRAAHLVDAVAGQRGLSRIELADRLVPALGLDGGRDLDFGPRRFQIAFDETLVPFVKDAQGARLKDLPKPRQSDDAALADAATLRYKQLKKELKALASVQLARLEQAMVVQRSWSPEEFQSFFVQHPLMRELAARLLWAVSDEHGTALGCCRIAEDGSLADLRDERFDVPSGARLRIAHPLLLAAGEREAFALQFADYEILQPFAQLVREIHRPGEIESGQSCIDRFQGADVATGAVIGLLERGWLRGPTGDGGVISTLVKPMGPTSVEAILVLDPGMPVMQLSAEPRQILGAVTIVNAERKAVPVGTLDPVLCSELLRDLHRLTPRTT